MQYFVSPTKGRLSLNQVFTDIMDYVHEDPECHYRLIVGTDSQIGADTCFVTAVVIHRVGRARGYYARDHQRTERSLKQRISTKPPEPGAGEPAGAQAFGERP